MENKNAIKHRKTTLISILFLFWISALLVLQILMFTPPFVYKIVHKFNIIDPFMALQMKVKPIFVTTDLNEEFRIQR